MITCAHAQQLALEATLPIAQLMDGRAHVGQCHHERRTWACTVTVNGLRQRATMRVLEVEGKRNVYVHIRHLTVEPQPIQPDPAP